jgi:hypothetical protein
MPTPEINFFTLQIDKRTPITVKSTTIQQYETADGHVQFFDQSH